MARATGFVLLMATALLSFGAMAADEGVTYDGKKIAITEVGADGSSDGRKFHTKDFRGSIYIQDANFFFGKRYANAENLIRHRFVELGFKLTDTMDGSDMALLFDSSGSMDMVNADAQAAHSTIPSNANIFGGISAGITAGIPGVLAFASGGLFQTDSKTSLMAMVMLKPVKTKGMFGEKINSSVKDGTFTNSVQVKYRLEKGNEATEDIVLKMLVDQWIKLYVVADGEPVAASAATATETLAEAKK